MVFENKDKSKTQSSIMQFTKKTTVKKHPRKGYMREDGTKVSPTTVKEHEREITQRPQLPEETKEKIKKGKGKNLIEEEELPEGSEVIEISEDEINPLEDFGLSQRQIEERIARDRLVDTEVYKKWRRNEAHIDDLEFKIDFKREEKEELEEKLKNAETEEQKNEIKKEIEEIQEEMKEIYDKLQEERYESNELYDIFRFLVEEEIVSEDDGWEEDFYDRLSEADRYNFKTLEQLEKEEEGIETKKNPFFKGLFASQETKEWSPVRIELSPNGDKVYLKWDNWDEKGDLKVESRSSVFRDVLKNHKGAWDNEGHQFIIEADELENVINDFGGTLDYYIEGEYDTEDDWFNHANIQKEIVIENETDNLIFEVKGNNIIIDSGITDAKNNNDLLQKVKAKLDGKFSREYGERVYPATEWMDADQDGMKDKLVMPIGLLSKAYWFMKNVWEMDVAVADTRPRNPISNPELRNKTLYNFQRKAVLESLIEGNGLIVSPTGTGKTMMAGGIISGFIEGAEKYEERTGKKVDVDTLFLVHKTTLREQAVGDFKELFEDDVNIGELKSGKSNIPSDTSKPDINIGTVQGMYSALKALKKGKKLKPYQKKNLELLREAELIFQDEAHHIVAKSYDEVFNQNKTVHKFGMTATPSKTKQNELLRVMKIGDKRIAITYPEAYAKGFLMKPKVVEFPIPRNRDWEEWRRARAEGKIQYESNKCYYWDPEVNVSGKIKGKRDSSGAYWDSNRLQIEHNERRNDLIIDHAKRLADAGKKNIILFKTKRHLQRVKDMIEEVYPEMNPVEMHGDMKETDVKRSKLMLENGQSQVALAIDKKIGEGFNMPELDSMQIVAGGQTRSKIEVLQVAGRVMRVKPDKKQPLIFEYKDDPLEFAEKIKKRGKHYDWAHFQRVPLTEEPPDYDTMEKGDELFKTKAQRVAWVNDFLDKDWSTDHERYQTSEAWKHFRKRGEAKKKKNVIKSKGDRKFHQTAKLPENFEELKKDELYDIAKERSIDNRSGLKKKELKRLIKYDNWGWTNKDLANARAIASNTEGTDDILEKALRRSIEYETGTEPPKENPSQMLTKMAQERAKKLLG